MTARHLALHFVTHLPSYLRKAVVSCMRREDRIRFVDKRAYVTKNELLAMAQEEEAWILESEAEARAAGAPVHPRDTTEYKYPPLLLGPLPLVTSVPIASIPNPQLCASRVCSVVPLA